MIAADCTGPTATIHWTNLGTPHTHDTAIIADTLSCTNAYTCECLPCTLERARAVRRGVRPDPPTLPHKTTTFRSH